MKWADVPGPDCGMGSEPDFESESAAASGPVVPAPTGFVWDCPESKMNGLPYTLVRRDQILSPNKSV